MPSETIVLSTTPSCLVLTNLLEYNIGFGTLLGGTQPIFDLEMLFTPAAAGTTPFGL
jgi:hypothetical protein